MKKTMSLVAVVGAFFVGKYFNEIKGFASSVYSMAKAKADTLDETGCDEGEVSFDDPEDPAK